MLGFCPDPDERRARGPHSLAGSRLPPLELIRLSPRGSNPLHINAAVLRWSWAASERPVIPFLFFLQTLLLFRRLRSGESEIFAVVHDRPGQPQVLGGDGDRRFPVTPSFSQVPGPTTEPVLLVAESS